MANKYDMVSIGHITSDILNYIGKVSNFTGGATYFSAFAAARIGIKLLVVTKMAEKDFGVLDELRKEGIEVIAIPSKYSTSIENIFETEDVDKRKVKLLTQADSFTIKDIPAVEAEVYNLTGVFTGEFTNELIKDLASRGKVALDLQAMLRTSENGTFAWKDWAEKRQFLPYITFLKVDSLEAEVVTGLADREAAAKQLFDWGAKEVMVSHSSEVIIYDGKEIHRAPFNPSNLTGRTGRGDTVFMSYICRRLTHDVADSVRFAAALTSIKMETPGPFKGSISAVLDRMKSST